MNSIASTASWVIEVGQYFVSDDRSREEKRRNLLSQIEKSACPYPRVHLLSMMQWTFSRPVRPSQAWSELIIQSGWSALSANHWVNHVWLFCSAHEFLGDHIPPPTSDKDDITRRPTADLDLLVNAP